MSQYRKFSKGNFLSFRTLLVVKIVGDKEEKEKGKKGRERERKREKVREREIERYITSFCRTFLSHTNKKARVTLLCFSKILVSRFVKDERGVGHHQSPSKFFCHKKSKLFTQELFCVSENSWYRKMLRKRGGVCHEFLSKLFWPIKQFVDEPLWSSENFRC